MSPTLLLVYLEQVTRTANLEQRLAQRDAIYAYADDVNPAWTAGAATPAAAVAAYRARVEQMTDVDRHENKEKTGVYLGVHATNPVNGESIPVFIADYVLMGYGTGAIMAVPAQDERDWDFAVEFGLPIIRTVQPPADFDDAVPGDGAYVGDGPAVNSSFLDGLGVEDAKAAIIEWLEANGSGVGMVTTKLRDWLFARQRYWGEPIPIVFDDDGNPISIPDEHLPVNLPELIDWAPRQLDEDSEPEPPLGRATEWATVDLDLGDGMKTYRRDLNVMPQWAGSCWYYLRYIDPVSDDVIVELGPRMQGVCAITEFDGEPRIGDSHRFMLRGREDDLWILSLRGAKELEAWEQLEVGSHTKARVTGQNQGGLTLKIGSHEAFMPMS